MTISVRVRGYRGCKYADIQLNPIALVAGRNAAGKTSLAQATAAVLCGEALPVPGLTSRADRSVLIYSGAGGAAVEMIGDSGVASMAWPAGELITDGSPPTATQLAAGFITLATLSPRDRAQELSALLHALPDQRDVAQALAFHDLGGDQVVGAIWDLIERKGWDGAYSERREKGAELKGAWREVTGATWGAKVGASWRPDLADEDMNESDLERDVRGARQAHERAIAAAAVSQAERDRLQQRAALYENLLTDLQHAEEQAKDLNRVLTGLEAERDKLPQGDERTPMPCPHCGQPVVLQRLSLVESRLIKGEGAIPPDELKARRMAIATADGQVAKARDDLIRSSAQIASLQGKIQAAVDARERIANWPTAVETGTDIEPAHAALQRAEERLASWRRKLHADVIHGRIMGNDIVVDMLAGDGLRAQKLARVLRAFCEGPLLRLTSAAGWAPLEIDSHMALTYGGRAYPLLSASEQYRVRAVLQLAQAQIEGAGMVVLDGADILDAPSRSSLFTILADCGIPALVCMTLSRREQVPALGDLGSAYWMEGGTAELLHQPREAAA